MSTSTAAAQQRKRDIGVLVLALAFVIASITYLARLKPNENLLVEQVLPAAQVAETDALRERFGDANDFIVVLVRAPAGGATSEMTDAHVAEIERSLRTLPSVSRTWSRLTRPRLEAPENKLRIATRGPTAAEANGKLDRFLAPDTRTASFIVSFSARATKLSGARELAEALEIVLARERAQGMEAYAVGAPLLRIATWEVAARDAQRILPVLIAVVIVVPFLFFRSIWASVFPFALAALSSGATLALHRIFTGTSNPWMLVLLPLVWSVATMDAMHFYESSRRQRGDDRVARIFLARRELLVPCLLTASTTALSLAILAAPGGPALFRSVGVWGAFGAVLAYALTFALGGPILRLMNDARPLPRWPSGIARRLVVTSARRPLLFLLIWMLSAGASARLIPRLTIESSYPRVFAAGDGGAFEDDLREVPAALGADLLPLEIHLEATTPHAREPESMMLVMNGVHAYLAQLPETRLPLSPATLIEEFITTNPSAEMILSQAARSVDAKEQASALLGETNLTHWVRLDLGAARMQVFFAKAGYERKEEMLRFIAHFVQAVYPEYRVRFSGPFYVHHIVEREGVAGVAQGVALDLLLIIVIFTLVLRRLRATIGAVLVNVVPVAVLLAAIVLAKIRWEIGLIGLPVVVLGLAVDDTVHLLWEARARKSPPLTALMHATRHSGNAVLSTCALLAGCLASLSRSGFLVNHELGVLLPLGLGLALLAELTLLPAILAVRIRRKRN